MKVKLRVSWFGRIVLVAAVLVLHLPADSPRVWSAEGEDLLGVGIAKVDITPEKPVRMSGYSGRKELSAGVHDPLYARVVAFEIVRR